MDKGNVVDEGDTVDEGGVADEGSAVETEVLTPEVLTNQTKRRKTRHVI